ncbi:MAG: hypothetical protein ACFN0W_03790 [Propionibacterium acidifaciens]|uniref:hypothetical protein n=1 Tax=Propionibacterium acidifaciens TaxID=556499 RepID=UPI00360F80D9
MPSSTVNTDNVFIGGSDNDSLYLGPASAAPKLAELKLYTDVPADLIAAGWLSDDGVTRGADDSKKALQGHQGHANVVVYMDSSESTLEATILEHKLQLLKWLLSATGGDSRLTDPDAPDGHKEYVELKAAHSRKIEHLCGIWDTYDTAHDGIKYRYVFPALDLSERKDMSDQPGNFSSLPCTLDILQDYRMMTNSPGMLPAAGSTPAGH